jgi:hypothetical protein
VHSACTSADHSPAAHDDGEEDTWLDLIKDHVGRNLCEDVANEENAFSVLASPPRAKPLESLTDHGVVLLVNQTEIFFEGSKSCSGDIVPVKVI